MKRLLIVLLALIACAGAVGLPAAARTAQRTIRLLSSARIGDFPGGIAHGFGSVWVADPLREAVDRISLRTGRLQATIHTGALPNFVAVGAGAVWASNTYSSTSGIYPGRTVVRIDPRRNRVARRIVVGPFPSQVRVSGRTLWVAVTGRAAVARVALPSGRVRLTATETAVGAHGTPLVWVQGPIGIAVAGGAAWTDSDGADAFFRVANNGRLTRAISLGQNEPCGRMYSYGETIWASGECTPVVWRINARTGRLRTINLGSIPGPGLIGDAILAHRSVWVTTDAGQLLRINPSSGRIAARYRLPAHVGAGSLTYAAGSLWESDFGDLDNGHGRVVRLALP
jgi:sugar lactone lactonase YvrE